MLADLESILRALLESERSLYEKLKVLVNKERLYIETDKLDSLMKILQEKQSIISDQEKLQEQWGDVACFLGIEVGREGPVFWEAVSARVSKAGYVELVKLIDQVRMLASEILESEEIAQSLLEMHVEKLRSRMSHVAEGRKAVKGYMGAGGGI